jgi:4-deoxy-L-threo-5-hexosulose-uronate ketol-isomerase
MPTGELREQFLLDALFAPGEMRLFHTALDRLTVGAVMPLPGAEILAANGSLPFFDARHEIGIINIGDPGQITIDGKVYDVGKLECMYIGAGHTEVAFRGKSSGQPAFYLLSCPAHHCYPTRLATCEEALTYEVGDPRKGSHRKIRRYIHEGGIQSCQLVMGFTELQPGSVWNTWPPHTHLRRSEVYLYFDLGSETVMHFLGQEDSTRHLVVHDREAVLSPPWSIHCGVGTGSYRFIWGMAGENQIFEDMDPVDLENLR